MLKQVKIQWLFLKALSKNPAMVGAAFPSSRYLGSAMAQQIPKETEGLIIELGAGTGAITSALTQRFSREQLVIIERSALLCRHLKKDFPDSQILLGDAANLPQLLQPFVKPVDAIVSSLPLRSMNPEIVANIQKAMWEVLQPQGLLVQFTYDPRKRASETKLGSFTYFHHENVWLNLPPARVDVYRKCVS